LGIELIRIVDIGAFQAIVADWNGRRIVAFRGTCNIRGWVTDCDCAMTKEGIHKGFDYAINVMAKELQPLVSGKDMLGTGHSLGGAMGTLAPRTLISKEAKTISFGAPRSADREAAVKIVLKNNTRPPERYVHGCDIVPDVPLNAMDYAHGDAPINLKQVPRPLCDFFVPMEFYSHVPTLYAERIWQINEECGAQMTLKEFLALPEVHFKKLSPQELCVHCKVSPANEAYQSPDGLCCSDCYFKILSEHVEKFPIVSPAMAHRK
jgi:hypothetical protein